MEDIFLDDDMEMPCMCDCGEWFDLNDGFKSYHSNKVVCKSCHFKEFEIKELEDRIFYLEIEGKGTKRLRSKVEALKLQLNTI